MSFLSAPSADIRQCRVGSSSSAWQILQRSFCMRGDLRPMCPYLTILHSNPIFDYACDNRSSFANDRQKSSHPDLAQAKFAASRIGSRTTEVNTARCLALRGISLLMNGPPMSYYPSYRSCSAERASSPRARSIITHSRLLPQRALRRYSLNYSA
jgi:hypothetical protein